MRLGSLKLMYLRIEKSYEQYTYIKSSFKNELLNVQLAVM